MAALAAPPPRTPHAGRRALPAALVASVAAHGLAVSLLVLAWRDAQAPASIGRTRGALQVSLRQAVHAAPRPAAAPAPRRPAAPPAAPRKPAPKPPAAHQHAKAEPAAAPAPSAPPAAMPPPAAPADTRPGARFASLFAPVVHSPLGRAGWATRPQHPAPPPVDPDQQREQALMALHAALRPRLAALAEQLRVAERAPACELVVDAEHRIAQVDCASLQDQALAWALLQGLLTAGTVADTAERLCFRVADRQVASGPCPGATALP